MNTYTYNKYWTWTTDYLNSVFEDDWLPKNDVKLEKWKLVDGDYAFEIELPGFKRENIKIEVDRTYVTISATQQDRKSYKKKFILNSYIDNSKITAKLEDGVLLIKFPLKEIAKPQVQLIKVE